MRKFIQLSVIDSKWCDSIATVDDVTFHKRTVLKHKCVMCEAKTNRSLYIYEYRTWKGLEATYHFCEDCLITKAKESGHVITLQRIVADHINYIINKDIFTAKRIAFRKSDILSVEGAAYDHSIINFNNGTLYKGKDRVRITERKNAVMKLLGETVNLPRLDKNDV